MTLWLGVPSRIFGLSLLGLTVLRPRLRCVERSPSVALDGLHRIKNAGAIFNVPHPTEKLHEYLIAPVGCSPPLCLSSRLLSSEEFPGVQIPQNGNPLVRSSRTLSPFGKTLQFIVNQCSSSLERFQNVLNGRHPHSAGWSFITSSQPEGNRELMNIVSAPECEHMCVWKVRERNAGRRDRRPYSYHQIAIIRGGAKGIETPQDVIIPASRRGASYPLANNSI